MKVLWITSFRGFKKKSQDTIIQMKFLKEISKNKNIDFCVTQFGETNVKKQLQKYAPRVRKSRSQGALDTDFFDFSQILPSILTPFCEPRACQKTVKNM